MNTLATLISRINQVSAVSARFDTSAKRVQAAQAIDMTLSSFGPSWMDHATDTSTDVTAYDMTPEQFADYLAAKRAFACGQ